MSKPEKFPKSMGACADLLYKYRQERLAADKVAAALKTREQALIEHIIDNLDKGSGGAVGKTHKVEITKNEKPVVKDWPVFFAWVAKTKSWDLLHKRVAESAFKARIEDNVEIPGWEAFTVVGVSLTVRLKPFEK